MAEETPAPPPPPPPPEYKFTLVIITPDGKTVYTVDSAELSGIAKTQAAQQAGPVVRSVLDLSSPIAHVRYDADPRIEVHLLGTFYINLAVYAPPK